MNKQKSSESSISSDKLTDFAPADYTDGRKKFDWETKYPKAALEKIRLEAIYVSILLVISIIASLLLILPPKVLCDFFNVEFTPEPRACLCAWFGGTAGGTVFSIKWLYHSRAKGIWHLDRRLWRIFAPHMSGSIAFFTILLIASGLLKVFEADIINEPLAILGFTFIVGYFSDKALAKMSELADFFLGLDRKKNNNKKYWLSHKLTFLS